ncbi:MAG TPA: translocation/assembly module TamB domain-containing protein [Kofleriaceae bacterium]|jgi:autotransporter translocation and assembly factor TamB
MSIEVHADEVHPHHPVRRVLRWVKRIVLGTLALVVVLVVAALIFIHTDTGREVVREQAEKILASTFTGGATLGKLEGSPFGDLVVRDAVINGPDGKPAIKVGKLTLHVHLFDLISHHVNLSKVIAEDVDVQLKRFPDGRLQFAELLAPRPDEPSAWNVDLSGVEIRRGHAWIDSGLPDAGLVDLDGLGIRGTLHKTTAGVLAATLELESTWRERNQAPLAIAADYADDSRVTRARSVNVRLGGVALNIGGLRVERRDGRAPLIEGAVSIAATRAGVLALAPRFAPPADVVLAMSTAQAGDALVATLGGTIGAATLQGQLSADLDQRHVTGTLSTGDVDLAALTEDKVRALAQVAIVVDAQPGQPGDLPVANVEVVGHGAYGDLPRSDFSLALHSQGADARATLAVEGAATAKLDAELHKAGDAIALTKATLTAATRDPKAASGGVLPARGTLDVALAAHGSLSPAPDLAVTGTIRGKAIRVQELSVASLDATIDAANLPSHPSGRVGVKLVDLVRGDVQFGALTLDAATRTDGRVAVTIQSRPKQEPWLVELAALVTVPHTGADPIVVDLGHHRVRAGNGVDWSGDGGRIVVAPAQISIANLRSASAEGKLAVDASYGRTSGDLSAKVDASNFALSTLRKGYVGTLGAHVTASRRGGRLSATVDANAKGLSLYPREPIVDLGLHVQADPGRVTANVKALGKDFGSLALDADVTAPAHLEDAAAWKASRRDALRSLKLHLAGVDLGRIALVLFPNAGTAHDRHGVPNAVISGRIDGDLALTTDGATGALHLRDFHAPQLAGVRSTTADLALAQPAPGQLAPTLTVTLADIGKATATANLALPDRLFDGAAWGKLGAHALRSAKLETDAIAIDPAMLARFGLTSGFRGKAKLTLTATEALGSIELDTQLAQVRGTPIATPVDARFRAALDGRALTVQLGMTATGGKPITQLSFAGTLPGTLMQLRADPKLIEQTPLALTAEFPKTDAAALLGTFGRSEITGGTLDGKIVVGGTLAKPTVSGHLTGHDITSQPLRAGRTVKTLREVALDADWKDGAGAVKIAGKEDGGGALLVTLHGSPGELSAATTELTATAFDMTPLLAFAPGPAGGSRGTLDAKLAVHGLDPRTAQITGELHIKDARIPIAPMIGTLRRANIDIKIQQHDIQLTAAGKLGKGDVKLNGTIALDGASIGGGNVTMQLRKVSPIGSIEPEVSADVTAKIARKGEQITADITVDHGFVKVGKGGEKLKTVGNPSDLTIGNARPKRVGKNGEPAEPQQAIIVANVTLHPVKVESTEFRTTIHGKFTATADADAIGMKGQIVADSGDLDLFSRRYTIERAGVTFDGSTDPMLDVRITHDFTDVTTVTQVRGRLSKPKLVLTSNPGLYSQTQLLGFLLGGEPGGDPTSSSARDKATNAGESLVAGQIAGYMKKALPFNIDVIKYEAASASSSAAVTVGSWITHTLFFSFTQHIDALPDENDEEGTLEYWFTRHTELQGTVGDRGYDGLDLIWRKRF